MHGAYNFKDGITDGLIRFILRNVNAWEGVGEHEGVDEAKRWRKGLKDKYRMAGRARMPYYIVLVNLTEEGKKNLAEGLKRRAESIEQLKKAGGRHVAGYFTFGQYDAIEIVELPNDESMLRLLLEAGTLGGAHTTTLKAFPIEEASKLIKR